MAQMTHEARPQPQDQDPLTNCPPCGHELDLAPSATSGAVMAEPQTERLEAHTDHRRLASRDDYNARSDWRRLIRSLFTGQPLFDAQKGEDEVVGVLLKYGLEGVNHVRSAESPRVLPADPPDSH
jgi:hypothetical protein